MLFVPVATFFILAAFSPATLAVPLTPGKPITAWFVYGLGLIAFSVTLGGIYVVAANRAARRMACALATAVLLAAGPAHAAPEPAGPSFTAISLFLALVLATLGITYWAARASACPCWTAAAGRRSTGRAIQNSFCG